MRFALVYDKVVARTRFTAQEQQPRVKRVMLLLDNVNDETIIMRIVRRDIIFTNIRWITHGNNNSNTVFATNMPIINNKCVVK
jgi:hypothetical protein